MKKLSIFPIIFLMIFSISNAAPVKRVVFEEGTGMWCGWCPAGAVYTHEMKQHYGDQIIIIAAHANDELEIPEYIENAMFQGYPTTVVDRKTYCGPLKMDDDGNIYNPWNDYVDERLAEAAMADITTTTNYNSETRELEIVLSAEFAADASGQYKFTALLCQDAITGPSPDYDQSNYFEYWKNGPMGGFETFGDKVYAAQIGYNHIPRAILGGFHGEPGALPEVITTAETYSHTFTYTIPGDWNPDYVYAVGMLIAPDNSIDNASRTKYISGPENARPVITSNPVVSGMESQEYNYDLYGIDPDNSELTFDVLEKPDWLTLTETWQVGAVHSHALLSGVPEAVGTYHVIIALSDDESTVTQEFDIEVSERDHLWRTYGEAHFTGPGARVLDMCSNWWGDAYTIVAENNNISSTSLYLKTANEDWQKLENICDEALEHAAVNALLYPEKVFYCYLADDAIKVSLWNGTEITTVGDNLPAGQFLDIDIYKEDFPVVVMADPADSYRGYAYQYDGSEWIMLGGGPFCDTARYCMSNQVEVYDDKIYVLWADASAGNYPTISVLEDGQWKIVGEASMIKESSSGYHKMAFDNGNLVLAVQLEENSRINAYQYTDDGWQRYGVDIAGTVVDNMDMGRYYFSIGFMITYIDVNNNNTLSAIKRDSGEWEQLGRRGFTNVPVANQFLPSNNTYPIICYTDLKNDNRINSIQAGYFYLPAVNEPGQAGEFDIYPNPLGREMNIRLGELAVGKIEVQIFDLPGRPLYRRVVYLPTEAGEITVPIPDLPRGIYTVSLRAGANVYYGKAIK